MRHTLQDAKDSIAFYQECMNCGILVPRADLSGLSELRQNKLAEACPGTSRSKFFVDVYEEKGDE